MASDCDSEEHYPSNPEESDDDYEKPSLAETKPNVAELLKQLQSSGALVKKQKTDFKCNTCIKSFPDRITLENHLLEHVSMPNIILERCDEGFDEDDMDDEGHWSEDEQELPEVKKEIPDITQILKNNSCITIKKPEGSSTENSSALSKLANLGILKKAPEASVESSPKKSTDDLMQKLGQLGGIKLKLKQNEDSKSFHIVNGLKQDLAEKTENDDDEWLSGDEPSQNQSDDEEHLSEEPETEDANIEEIEKDKTTRDTQDKLEPIKNLDNPKTVPQTSTSKVTTNQEQENTTSMEQTKVVIKEEPEEAVKSAYICDFSGQIKTERSSPPPPQHSITNSLLPNAEIKKENEPISASSLAVPLFNNVQPVAQPVTQTVPKPIEIVEPKKENDVTIIEINGDSADEDDDCCVVSATPATLPDIKPKIEEVIYPSSTTSTPFTSSRTGPTILSSKIVASGQTSTEKQHNFNWNAPDQKPPMEALEKSTDALFENLFSSPSKKDSYSLDTTSEYVSLDTLGAQHTCQVCNTKFTSISMLESHKISTGHSNSLMPSSSGAVLPASYGAVSSSNILDNLLGGKLLPVGRQSSSQPFTHQQNVLINIQSYPGAMGQPMMGQAPMGQQYNPYTQQPPMYNNMPGPGQYPSSYGQPNMGYQQQSQQQYQPQPGQQAPYMQQGLPQTPGQAGTYPPGMQNNMQQPNMQQPNMQQPGQYQMQPGLPHQMLPPNNPPHSQSYTPTSSPNSSSKSGIRIQNVQSMGPNTSPRPRMSPIRPRLPSPNVRPGMRPGIRPGVHVPNQQMRGKVPMRMPMKRPGQMPPGPMAKRKPDMLLPGRHENEDCQTMSIQKQREGLPLISNIQGSKLGSEISITKKKVSPATAVANALAARGISVKTKAKSRSPSPERPIPHIPGLGSAVSIKHTPKKTSDGFTIPEARVGGFTCKLCRRSFPSQALMNSHIANAHGTHKCEDCPASYPTMAQLQHHRRVFHSEVESGRELGIPVVDLSQEGNLRRLADLGIYNFIPLANREEVNGCFGIPIVTTRNASMAALSSLGANGVLSLGPLKSISS